MALFLAVAMWNSYFSAMIYLTDETKYPLQLILNQILVEQQLSSQMGRQLGGRGNGGTGAHQRID